MVILSFVTTVNKDLQKFKVSIYLSVKALKKIPQSWPHQDLLSRNVLGLAMLMFLPRRQYHHDLRLTDGLTVLSRIEIVDTINHPTTLHTQ